MLKYLYAKEIFREVPDEITLGISISGCKIRCYGCHSQELWRDTGTPLTVDELDRIIKKHKGVTCVCLMGGESDILALAELFAFIHYDLGLRTAWYCGLDSIPTAKRGIIQVLDYYKVGHYDHKLGGLDKPTTNQRLYKIEHLENGDYRKTDITFKLQKN